MQDSRGLLVLVAAISACSGGGRGERAGQGAQGFVADVFTVGSVTIDPVTYHWVDPSLLITSSEGAGPRTLDISVSNAVSPHVSYTGTRSPSHADLTQALGYDVGQTVVLIADSSVLVPINAYARVAAYPTFQRATWDVVGPGGVPVGSGAAWKPIGVYFDTCGCIGPDPCGAGCVAGFLGGGGALPAQDSPDAGP